MRNPLASKARRCLQGTLIQAGLIEGVCPSSKLQAVSERSAILLCKLLAVNSSHERHAHPLEPSPAKTFGRSESCQLPFSPACFTQVLFTDSVPHKLGR